MQHSYLVSHLEWVFHLHNTTTSAYTSLEESVNTDGYIRSNIRMNTVTFIGSFSLVLLGCHKKHWNVCWKISFTSFEHYFLIPSFLPFTSFKNYGLLDCCLFCLAYRRTLRYELYILNRSMNVTINA